MNKFDKQKMIINIYKMEIINKLKKKDQQLKQATV